MSYTIPIAVREVLSNCTSSKTSGTSTTTIRTPKPYFISSRRPRTKAAGVKFLSPKKTESSIQREDEEETFVSNERIRTPKLKEFSLYNEEAMESCGDTGINGNGVEFNVQTQAEASAEGLLGVTEEVEECDECVGGEGVDESRHWMCWEPVEQQRTCSRCVPVERIYLKNATWGMKADGNTTTISSGRKSLGRLYETIILF